MKFIQNTKYKIQNTNSGYITLMLILIVGAISFAIVFSILSSGITSTRIGLAFMGSYKAREYADACIEDTLYIIHAGTASTTGCYYEDFENSDSGTDCGHTIDNEGCRSTFSGDYGSTWEINSTGQSGRLSRDITVNAEESSGDITITGWSE